MTLANLNGLKSRTSRTRGLNEINQDPNKWELKHLSLNGEANFQHITSYKNIILRCPYGKVGDTLYGKETYYQYGFWATTGILKSGKSEWTFVSDWKHPIYYCDTLPKNIKILNGFATTLGYYKRSAMMMPERASRYHIILEKIIYQRIQSITVEDIIREGLSTKLREHDACCDLKKQWITLWDSINAKPKKIITPTHKPITILDVNSPYSWKSNPWVLALYYRVVKKEI